MFFISVDIDIFNNATLILLSIYNIPRFCLKQSKCYFGFKDLFSEVERHQTSHNRILKIERSFELYEMEKINKIFYFLCQIRFLILISLHFCS